MDNPRWREYPLARCIHVSEVSDTSGELRLRLEIGGGGGGGTVKTLRCRMSVDSAWWMLDGLERALSDYRARSQAPTSSGSPSVDGSTPPGHVV